jgi:4-amino-4-deoxy-L-arabinose transferase-like glycosyltransferase
VETIPERLEPEPQPLERSTVDAPAPDTATIDRPAVTRVRTRRRPRAIAVSRRDVIALLAVYFATRGVLLLAAYLLSSFGHHNFLHELANWDGLWYREVANQGYLHHPSDGQTTLGFFPLYPLAVWALSQVVMLVTVHDAIWSATVAGVLISTTGGAIATYLVYRLGADWWDRRVAFRAGVLFVLFPGSVVFSMVYSEGLLLPLAAGCLFALGRKRWLLAGVLAGFGTAVQPVAIVLVFVCAAAALIELRRSGWTRRVLRKVSVAPLLSLAGISAFAVFLWFWTGTPFANYRAQHHGWGEKTDAFAIGHLTSKLVRELFHRVPHEPTVDLNLVVGLIGAVLLLLMLVLAYRQRHHIPPAALVWTGGVSFLALTSEYVPPNPRMLITAFPALMAVARYAEGRTWRLLLWVNGVLLVVLSVFTFYGTTLRP